MTWRDQLTTAHFARGSLTSGSTQRRTTQRRQPITRMQPRHFGDWPLHQPDHTPPQHTQQNNPHSTQHALRKHHHRASIVVSRRFAPFRLIRGHAVVCGINPRLAGVVRVQPGVQCRTRRKNRQTQDQRCRRQSEGAKRKAGFVIGYEKRHVNVNAAIIMLSVASMGGSFAIKENVARQKGKTPYDEFG